MDRSVGRPRTKLEVASSNVHLFLDISSRKMSGKKLDPTSMDVGEIFVYLAQHAFQIASTCRLGKRDGSFASSQPYTRPA